jgi:ABC-type anion transport system duplicated permease subunit
MYETFAIYWVSLLVVFAVFAVTGMFGIGAVVRSALHVQTYHARMVGAAAGAVLGFTLLGTLPIFG